MCYYIATPNDTKGAKETMRKEAKTTKSAQLANIQGYHQGGYSASNHEAYAYMGFRSNKYFTSDRFIPLNDNFERPDGQPLQGFGLEIETECKGILEETVLAEVLDKIVFAHFPADLFKMQHDGSLGGRTSAECITQVMTKSFIRNHYRDFKLMYNTYFPAFQISADSATTSCGMHVNISNAVFGKTRETQAEAIRKLYYIINKHYAISCNLLYRKGSTRYCGQMDYSTARTMNLSGHYADHSVCFNLGHYDAGRIELRLVGGQKNYACFRNTMESVFFLCERVRSISWADCDNVAKIFRGCNQYVFDRLQSMCGLSAETLAEIRATVKTEELL
jgi:hypothetical protein